MTKDEATMSEQKEKIAPVQGYSAGIPWSMHLRAYDAYRKRYGSQPALIDLAGRGCRGGFGTSELDQFIPGWREELDERTSLRKRIATLEAEITALKSTVASLLSIDDSKVAEYVVLSPEALKAAAGNRVAELEAKVQRLEAPVTEAEWDAHAVPGNSLVRGIDRVSFRAIIAARSTPPAKENAE